MIAEKGFPGLRPLLEALIRRCENFFRRRLTAFRVTDDPILPDQVHRTFHEQAIGVVLLAHFLARIHQ